VLKKTITYEDFNGETVSEDFFFHLSKAELVELEMSYNGGLSVALERIIAAEDGQAIIKEFKNIILGAYGQRSSDGRRFIKNQILRDEFESSEAYSTLFMELVTDTNAAIEFVNGVVPKNLTEDMAKLAVVPEPISSITITPEPQIVTKADMAKMSPEELAKLGNRISSGEVKLGE
jgi:hypothetical protein